MKNIFISYRRDDARYPARNIHTALVKFLPREQIFMDIDSIPVGVDFVEVLEGWVRKCHLLLALIGPGWINSTDPKTSSRRLDDANDFVRIEIREALARAIPVVPVLIDGTPMPDAQQLPDDLKGLVRRQAEFVEFRTFDTDVDRLIRKLGLDIPPPETRKKSDPGSASNRILVHVGPPSSEQTLSVAPPGDTGDAKTFQDIAGGPEMIVVPAGHFVMGSLERKAQGPQHKVTFGLPFSVSRYPVTRGQFAAFVLASGYKADGAYVWTGGDIEFTHDPTASWRNPGFAQEDNHPAVCINWDDANAYASWLALVSGQPYRLLAEAEWEYAARAGTMMPFWWGPSISPADANYGGSHGKPGSNEDFRHRTVAVKSFLPNPWGLYQVLGNVWEWCADTWHENYEGAPANGSAWITGDPSRRVARGGSWVDGPDYLRVSFRGRFRPASRYNFLGFRVARTIV